MSEHSPAMFIIEHTAALLEICEKTALIFCAHLHLLTVFAVKLFAA